jgi:hypothetical protein
VLVPVSDVQAFLDGNFAAREGNRYTRPDGLSVTIHDLGSHVLISDDEAAARDFKSGEGLAAVIEAEFKDAARVIDTGEMFMFANRRALDMASARMREAARAVGAQALPQPPPCQSALMVIDVDPLAVIARSLAHWDAPVERAFEVVSESSVSLTALPSKPFYFALAANAKSLPFLQSQFTDPESSIVAAWLWDAQSVYFAAYPSPAGLAGGLLNDSALIVKSSDPVSMLASIKASVLAIAQDSGAIQREVKWEDSRSVKEVGDAAAFEIRTVEIPPALANQQIAEQLIFGRTGIRGFISIAGDSTVMTFSQRPAVLAAALTAIAEPAEGLESSPMLQTMRQWMPAHRDFEGYRGVAQLVEKSRQVMQSFGLAEGPIPAIEAGSPPVGFAMGVDGAVVETSLIVPGPIAAAMVDEAMRQFAAVARTTGNRERDTGAIESKDEQ